MKKILIILAVLIPVLSYAQPDEVAAKKIRATEKLQVKAKAVTLIRDTVDAASTILHLPTSKAVWDLFGTISPTITTDATLSGAGTVGSPLKIAQQSATSGQVLKWNGTTWLPAADAGTNVAAGTGISIGGTAPNITVNNTGVTSVGLTMPSIFSVSGSPVTGSGTLAAAISQNRSAMSCFNSSPKLCSVTTARSRSNLILFHY